MTPEISTWLQLGIEIIVAGCIIPMGSSLVGEVRALRVDFERFSATMAQQLDSHKALDDLKFGALEGSVERIWDELHEVSKGHQNGRA